MQIFTVLLTSIFYCLPAHAKGAESFNDSFGMEFVVNGKVQDVMARWNVICGRGCVIQTDELICSDTVDFFNTNRRFRSSDDGTLTIGGHWSQGAFTLSFKDGSEQWTCQLKLNDRHIKDVSCQATNKHDTLILQMPDRDIPWRERCKNVRFRGKS